MPALAQGTFVTNTVHIIKPNTPRSEKAIVMWQYQIAIRDCSPCIGKIKHSANYSGVLNVPIVVTDCAPIAIVEDLHSAKSIGTVNQADADWFY